MGFYCYVIETNTDNLYVGLTVNIERRLNSHRNNLMGWVSYHGGFRRVVEVNQLPHSLTKTEARLVERGKIQELTKKYPSKLVGGTSKRYRNREAPHELPNGMIPFGTSTYKSVRDQLNRHCHEHGVRVWAFVTAAIC